MIGLFDTMSILRLARPTWVVSHVAVGAVDALVKIANPWNHSSNPCRVVAVVLFAVLVGGLADWAKVVGVILRKEEIVILLQWWKCSPWNRCLLMWAGLVILVGGGVATSWGSGGSSREQDNSLLYGCSQANSRLGVQS